MHLAAWKESSDRPEVPVGRVDQFSYPYYQADIERGKLTRAQAAELVGAFWLKIREVENLVTIKREHRAAPGSQLPNVTLCGRDKDGVDLTNEVSWIMLEVMAQIHLSEPAVYVRYHEDQDENSSSTPSSATGSSAAVTLLFSTMIWVPTAISPGVSP